MDNVLGLARTGLIFTRNPGRGTAGWADPTPTWPNRAGYSIPCAVMLGSAGGGTHSRLGSARRWSCPGERVCCASLCCIFSLSVLLLLLFPLFTALLNCPYPDPPVFASFFSFFSACQRGEVRPRGPFVAGGSRNENTCL